MSNGNQKNQLFKNIFASSLTISTTVSLFNPLDCFRIKWQTHVSQSHQTQFQFFRSIIKKHGLIDGLWKPGLNANIIGAACSRGIGMGFYPVIRDFLDNVGYQNEPQSKPPSKTPLKMFIAGMISGSMGYMLSCPFWLIKTRQQSGYLSSFTPIPRSFNDKSIFNNLRDIKVTEGIQNGLFRGAGCLAIRGALMNGGNTLGYDGTKTWIRTHYLSNGGNDTDKLNKADESIAIHFIASINAALLSSTLSLPVDILTTFHMASSKRSGSIWNTFKSLYVKHGFQIFFRGWVPMFGRVAPIYCVYLPFYEQVRKMMGIGYLT